MSMVTLRCTMLIPDRPGANIYETGLSRACPDLMTIIYQDLQHLLLRNRKHPGLTRMIIFFLNVTLSCHKKPVVQVSPPNATTGDTLPMICYP